MAYSDLTIGDVLPSDMKSNYSPAVLNTSVEEALQIAKYDMPPTSDLSEDDVKSIDSIYEAYISKNNSDSDSAYWNKSPGDNEAYWNKK